MNYFSLVCLCNHWFRASGAPEFNVQPEEGVTLGMKYIMVGMINGVGIADILYCEVRTSTVCPYSPNTL